MATQVQSWLFRLVTICFLAPALWVDCVHAAYIEFTNCLAENVIKSNPRILQFVPLNVSAVFDLTDPKHNLNVTFYGNVTGQLYPGTYPPIDSPIWSNPNESFGKIVDVLEGAELATTLFADFNMLSYTPYNANPQRFCEAVINNPCPLGPAFEVNRSQLRELPAYTVAHDLYSTYAFTSIAAQTRIQSGQGNDQFYGCVIAHITPDLGESLRSLLRYLPLGLLIVVGIATVAAAMFSPWSSLNIFHWTSNFGRDEDVLRLVTPGFGDCLQYIQFVVLTGSLSLNYPGFFQPVVSRVGWSTLLFNESLVSHGDGTISIMDGLYVYRNNSKQGLDRMTQLIGMTSPKDAWAGMMVWLVVIIVCVLMLTQIGFLLRWIYRQVKDVPPEDLQSKNWYFTVGNVVRIALNFFLLPLVSLSMYQFVIASMSPTVSIALSAVVLIAIIAFTIWLVLLFARTRPRSFLFDDLQTLLAYGPLYNTYRDDTARFALIPILINFVRGIAIGAIQASGVAQVVLLAICEVVMILTVVAFRPYPATTSMNIYHTCFSIIRLLTLLLSIAFIPQLNAGSASRGWIGYAILLIHACVLVFGFFLNAIQTLIEVIARLAGAGGTGGRDAARGGLVKVFGMRQLSKRLPRREHATAHNSMSSNTQMLAMQEVRNEKIRSGSVSASSTMLLDGNGHRANQRASQILDGSSGGRVTPDAESMFSSNRLSRTMAPGSIVGIPRQVEAKDPYYRPPRRNTIDLMSGKERPFMTNENPVTSGNEEAIDTSIEGSSTSPVKPDDFEDTTNELTKTKTDYAVREVDFYYRVRGPALSAGTRKLKTGPADPTGPVSSATGWFKGLLGGKTKEKGKGFEVVRGAKAHPGLMAPMDNLGNQPGVATYRDELETNQRAPVSPVLGTRDIDNLSEVSAEDVGPSGTRPLESPFSLPEIDTVGGIELPSRIGSQASRKLKAPPIDTDIPEVPPVPRRSSRRHSNEPSETSKRNIQTVPIAALGSNKDNNTGRLPFSGSSGLNTGKHSAANSEASSYRFTHDQAPVVDALTGYREDRPESIGYVNHHRASDNIRYSPDEAQTAYGSSAEYGYSGNYDQRSWSPSWNGSSAADGSKRFSRFRD